nr:MAG TPA: hypothetical protein [Bacteriophage sp.]
MKNDIEIIRLFVQFREGWNCHRLGLTEQTYVLPLS